MFPKRSKSISLSFATAFYPNYSTSAQIFLDTYSVHDDVQISPLLSIFTQQLNFFRNCNTMILVSTNLLSPKEKAWRTPLGWVPWHLPIAFLSPPQFGGIRWCSLSWYWFIQITIWLGHKVLCHWDKMHCNIGDKASSRV